MVLKLNILQTHQIDHALKIRVDQIKSLCREVESGIMNAADIQDEFEMKQKQILDLHKKMYNYWQGKNGKWYTYLPKEGVAPPKGKQIESIDEEKLKSKIIAFYVEEEARKKQEKACPTFLDVYDMWRKIKDLELSDNSIYKYNTDCKRFLEDTDFGNTPIDQITENTIRLFLLRTIKELKLCKKSSGKLFGYIKNTIRYARAEKIILDNPMEFLEPKDFTKHSSEVERTRASYYTDNELLILLNGLRCHYGSAPTYMPAYAVELAIYTGMRVSELSTLKWTDISDGYISINKSAKFDRMNKEYYVGNTKTKKSRIYPIDAQITQLLERIRCVQEENHILCEWIFTDGNGGYVHAGNITSYMTRLCRECGLSGGGLTRLRKTASSDLQMAGTPKAIVASMLGHTCEVNEKYYTYDTSNLERKKEIIQNRNVKFKDLTSAR